MLKPTQRIKRARYSSRRLGRALLLFSNSIRPVDQQLEQTSLLIFFKKIFYVSELRDNSRASGGFVKRNCCSVPLTGSCAALLIASRPSLLSAWSASPELSHPPPNLSLIQLYRMRLFIWVIEVSGKRRSSVFFASLSFFVGGSDAFLVLLPLRTVLRLVRPLP